LAIPLSADGPQTGEKGRTNPIRVMLATGTDAVAGKQDEIKVRYVDDMVTMPTQCATHWDALGHVFHEQHTSKGEKKVVMWNGYPAERVNCSGCEICGIQNYQDKMVGRGILLNMARYGGVEGMAPGEGITGEDLDNCASEAKVAVKRGDFVLVRTGQLGQHLKSGTWAQFAGGDAPGLEFEMAVWLHDKEVAAIATDTWGVEVRPNRSDEFYQPWHWLAIPMLGIAMGEIFNLDDLAEDCVKDGIYEFLMVAAVLPFKNGAGSPVNPLAIKLFSVG
jgi:kynurenine formamidase